MSFLATRQQRAISAVVCAWCPCARSTGDRTFERGAIEDRRTWSCAASFYKLAETSYTPRSGRSGEIVVESSEDSGRATPEQVARGRERYLAAVPSGRRVRKLVQHYQGAVVQSAKETSVDTLTPEGSPTLSTEYSTPELKLSPELTSDRDSFSCDSNSPPLSPRNLRYTPIEVIAMALSC